MSELKRLPIGTEDFKELIDKDYCFVDKTLLIKELIDNLTKVQLFTRPRRFGKTLNMSMIRRFFEKTLESNAYLFEGLNISKAGEKYMKEQGKYPVISLTLKKLGTDSFENAFDGYKKIIAAEFDRHHEILNSSSLTETDKQRFNEIKNFSASEFDYAYAIKFLSDCLFKTMGTKVIILIDEYDVPLDYSWQYKFYDKMVSFIRSAFGDALKTNDSLEFACLTGCLRISKESIFTGMNNFSVYSVISPFFSEYFGFTETEVAKMAEYYGVLDRMPEIKDWYDGYIFGGKEIYNPLSVSEHIKLIHSFPNYGCKAYWANTSSNEIIHKLLKQGDAETKSKVETLMNDGTTKAELHEEIVYGDVMTKPDGIWNMLLFTGYLKPLKTETLGVKQIITLTIPNKEVHYIYQEIIKEWFDAEIATPQNGITELFNALISGESEKLQDEINDLLQMTISYFDEKEQFYHGFMSALLAPNKNYAVKSNRENGDGRPDITVTSYPRRDIAIIIELKYTETFDDLEKKCQEALSQIEEENYDLEFRQYGYKKILKYGIAFWKKTCRVIISE